MAHHPPAPGFTWPVPPEDISGVPVLILEWNAEGRVTVREEPLAVPEPAPPEAPASVPAAVAPVPQQKAEAAVSGQSSWAAVAGDRLQSPHLRERATWLGLGALIGITLAASMLPDAPGTIGPRPNASEGQPRAESPLTLAPRPQPAASSAGVALLAATAAPARSAASLVPPREVNRQPEPGRAPSASVRPVRRVAANAPGATGPRHADPAATPPTTDVLREVRRYESALSRLDAAATLAVFPAADRGALVQQFTSLREQRLHLERCTVDAPGDTAAVSCRGTLKYRPRVGDHSTRTTRGTWRFALERDGQRWVIEDVAGPAGPTP